MNRKRKTKDRPEDTFRKLLIRRLKARNAAEDNLTGKRLAEQIREMDRLERELDLFASLPDPTVAKSDALALLLLAAAAFVRRYYPKAGSASLHLLDPFGTGNHLGIAVGVPLHARADERGEGDEPVPCGNSAMDRPHEGRAEAPPRH